MKDIPSSSSAGPRVQLPKEHASNQQTMSANHRSKTSSAGSSMPASARTRAASGDTSAVCPLRMEGCVVDVIQR